MPLPDFQQLSIPYSEWFYSAPLAPYVNSYYLPSQMQFIAWDFPNVVHSGIDIDYKMTGYDWFNRELTWSIESGAAGMTIDTDGTLHWVPPTNNVTQNVVIGLSFNGTGKITKTFTITVNNARCLFISTTGSDTTGNGAISTPYASLNAAAANFIGNTTGWTVYYRGGNYTVNNQLFYGGSFSGLQSRLQADPFIVRSYPGELANFSFPSTAGFRCYHSGFVYYGFKVSQAVVDETAGVIVYDGSVGKLLEITGCTGNTANNVTGIYSARTAILDSCNSYDNLANAFSGAQWNESNYLHYATGFALGEEHDYYTGNGFILNCISSGNTYCGFKIKHAGITPPHYQNCVDGETSIPFAGACNKSSVRHSMFYGSTVKTLTTSITDPTTSGENNTDEGMLIDSNIIFDAVGSGALDQAVYAFQTTVSTTPATYVRNQIQSLGSGAGNIFTCGEFGASGSLVDGWRIDFTDNEVYTSTTSNSLRLIGGASSLGNLFAYGTGNSQVGQKGFTKIVQGREFQIVGGVFSEVV